MERDLQSLLDILQSAQIATNYLAVRSRDKFPINCEVHTSSPKPLLKQS